MPLSEHVIRHRVQFYETDAAGIVHFRWYLCYMEEAEHALWVAAGLDIAPTSEVTFPRVAVNCEFRRPLRFQDEFDILIRIASIEERRLSYAFTMTLEGLTVATGGMTIACVAPSASPHSIPFPTKLLDRFAVA